MASSHGLRFGVFLPQLELSFLKGESIPIGALAQMVLDKRPP